MNANNLLVSFSLLILSTSALAATQNRCGYIENPTPGNYSLLDSAGEWIISVQGGHQAEGDVATPKTAKDPEYVLTNGNYGYWCGCVTATVDAKEMKVLKIKSSRMLPLNTCLRDRKLKQAFRPVKIIHSNGKAYTECLEQDEQEIGFRARRACVNKAGEYYYLAD